MASSAHDSQSLTKNGTSSRFRHSLFALATVMGAYLLFQIEPVVGKLILPRFGGSPAVWSGCLLFFQLMLLAGYCYAHFSLSYLHPIRQAWLHCALLILALTLLPIRLSDAGPLQTDNPLIAILSLLLHSVGLPFFLLSTTSPMIQAWFARQQPQPSPYPLYALSNLASLIALLSYPFAVEPYFSLSQQTRGWSWGFALYTVMIVLLAIDACKRSSPSRQETVTTDYSALPASKLSSRRCWFYWLSLPTISSALLLAVSNLLCQDVASIPFLWIVPLTAYLLSYVISYSKRNGCSRRYTIPLGCAGIVALVGTQFFSSHLTLGAQVTLYCLGLFNCCLMLHAELYLLRPQPQRLTAYYLASSAGGALGGLLVAIAAPLVFSMYLEFPLALLLCAAVTMAVVMHTGRPGRIASWSAAAGLLLLSLVLGEQIYRTLSAQLAVTRNFYGVLRVQQRDDDQPQQARRVLRHGAIDHGIQYLHAAKKHQATAYYRPETGVGLAIRHLYKQQDRHIGLVGLGVGTLVGYLGPSDAATLYEINPDVVMLAQQYFSYLSDTPARLNYQIADARLTLERQMPQQFDLLVLDAFSGDAIPMHLLTEQALQIYLRHLSQHGVIAVHITNHYLDLRPLIRGLAHQSKLFYGFVRETFTDADSALYRSHWALLSRDEAFFRQPAIAQALSTEYGIQPELVWTDDFSNLYRLLK
jgi:hypothetical protein